VGEDETGAARRGTPRPLFLASFSNRVFLDGGGAAGGGGGGLAKVELCPISAGEMRWLECNEAM
jgi:hypothetical protein